MAEGPEWIKMAIIGDIGNILATLEFDTDTGEEPWIYHHTSSIYLIGYRGAGGTGKVVSVSISGGGSISAVIDSLDIDTPGTSMRFAKITDTIYVASFMGVDNDAWLRSFSVDSDGIFGGLIDSKEVDATYGGRYMQFFNLSGNIWLIAFQGESSDGWMHTLTINTNGTFGAVISSREFDGNLGFAPSLVNVSGDVFAIAYTGPDSDGWLKTWEIQSNGQIATAKIAELEFDLAYGYFPQLIHISGSVFAIFYRGSNLNYGYIKTVSIASDGTIGSIIDTYQFTTNNVVPTMALHVAEEVYAFVYFNTITARGYVSTVTIHNDGQIDEPLLDSLELDPTHTQATAPSIVYVTGNTYAIAFSGPDTDGYVITVNIVTMSGMKGLSSAAMGIMMAGH